MALKKTISQLEQELGESKAKNLISTLFDGDNFTQLDKYLSPSVITGYGYVDGRLVYIYAQDSEKNSGAVDTGAAIKIKKVYELAVKTGAPVVGVFDSKGGDITQGSAILAAYGEIAASSTKLSGVVPQISVVTGVCGGSMALIATMSDFVIVTQEAKLFLNSPFVTDDGNIEGAGTGENATKSGVANITVQDAEEGISTARKLISILPSNNLGQGGNDDFTVQTHEIANSDTHKELALAIANTDSLVELYKGFGENSYTALGSINWFTTAFVSVKGAITPNDSKKIASLVQFADAFSIPVVTIIDTEGFKPSSSDELVGSIRDGARLAQVYATATTGKISLITGKAYSSAFIALAGKNSGSDFSFAWEDAVISPMEPSAAVVFLHGDNLGEESNPKEKLAQLTQDYINDTASPFTAAQNGLIDNVITPEETRDLILNSIAVLADKRVSNPSKKHINLTF